VRLSTSHSESLTSAINVSRFRRSRYPDSIPQGTAIPRWAFFNVTVNIFPSIDVLMLRFDTESSVNQTYDQATMISIGRKFVLEPASPALFTSLIRGS